MRNEIKKGWNSPIKATVAEVPDKEIEAYIASCDKMMRMTNEEINRELRAIYGRPEHFDRSCDLIDEMERRLSVEEWPRWRSEIGSPEWLVQ